MFCKINLQHLDREYWIITCSHYGNIDACCVLLLYQVLKNVVWLLQQRTHWTMLEMLVNVTLASSVVTRPDCPVWRAECSSRTISVSCMLRLHIWAQVTVDSRLIKKLWSRQEWRHDEGFEGGPGVWPILCNTCTVYSIPFLPLHFQRSLLHHQPPAHILDLPQHNQQQPSQRYTQTSFLRISEATLSHSRGVVVISGWSEVTPSKRTRWWFWILPHVENFSTNAILPRRTDC